MRFRVGTIRLTVDDAWRSNCQPARRRLVSLLIAAVARPLRIRGWWPARRTLGVRRYA